jgi:hypothetical protein
MPDQYDPKLSRAPGDRRQSDARRAAADDPLAELARIVQGRPAPAVNAPRVAPQPPPASNGAGGADLEAELLNDLQASFAAVRDARQPPPPPAAPSRPVTAAVQPPPPPPVVETVEDEEEFVPPMVARPEPRTETRGDLRDEFRLEPFDEKRLVPIPTPPVIQPMIQTSAEPPPPPRPIFERRPEPAPERPAERPAAKVQSAPPPVVPDLSAFQLRGSASTPAAAPPVQPAPAPTRQPHSRWERPEPARPQSSAPSRFAPPRTAAPTIDEDEDLDPFAEGGLFADQVSPPEADDELELEDLGTLPPYADEEQLPPLGDEFDELPQRRGLGVAFAMLRGGGTVSGTPPVITADGSPTKITPDDTTAANDSNTQNKLIYDRVNSGGEASTDTTLVKPDAGPVQDAGSQDSGNAISRVIIPGGPGFDAPGGNDGQTATQSADAGASGDPVGELAANDAQASADADSIQPIGPRKVRTVVVKPDGTIVYSNAKDAQAPAETDAATTTAPAAEATTANTPVETVPTVTDDVAAITGADNEALPITAPAANDTTASADTATQPPAADTQPPPAATTKPAATKPAATKPATTTTDVATADDGASPIDIVPESNPPPANGGVLVQISSQRSEDAARATYRDLQARYPNILGSYQVNIQRADIADRGTFYRVRVGPFSQGDAQRLCDDLRQAGGDCVLAKR